MEHNVFYREFGDRVGKITRDKPQFVRDYLLRLILQNAVFGDDIRLEGVTFHQPSGRLAVVTSQSFRAGGGENPHPAQAEIDEFMKQAGFTANETPEGFYKGHGIIVADSTPKNWIKNVTGELMPIDLQIGLG